MISFKFNPEYVPGGVNNFWVSSQTVVASGDANVMAAIDSAVTSGNNIQSPKMSSMFNGGFFTNTAAAAAVASKSEERSGFIRTKTAAKATNEFRFPAAGGWKFIEPSDFLCLT